MPGEAGCNKEAWELIDAGDHRESVWRRVNHPRPLLRDLRILEPGEEFHRRAHCSEGRSRDWIWIKNPHLLKGRYFIWVRDAPVTPLIDKPPVKSETK